MLFGNVSHYHTRSFASKSQRRRATDTASRSCHFWLMWLFILFVVPHVILVLADSWDTLRSMIVGWSTRVKRPEFNANEE